MNATYTKLKSGDWGIRVQGQVEAGQAVAVTKKAGGSKTETVQKVLWTGNGINLCSIVPAKFSSSAQRAGGWTGCRCGSIEGKPRTSDCWQCQHDY